MGRNRGIYLALVLTVTATCDVVSGLTDFRTEPSGATTGAGGGGSGAGGTTVGPGTGGANPTADYTIPQLPPTRAPTIDGACTDTEWDLAEMITFEGYDDSDNTPLECRFLWKQGGPVLLYGCCHIGDQSLEADITGDDVLELFDDDSIEMILDPNTDDIAGAETLRFLINGIGSTYDANLPNGVLDAGHNANIVHAITEQDDFDGQADDEYWNVEWSVELPFAVEDDMVGKCQLVINDDDAAGRTLTMAYGDNANQINLPTTWGRCHFDPALP